MPRFLLQHWQGMSSCNRGQNGEYQEVSTDLRDEIYRTWCQPNHNQIPVSFCMQVKKKKEEENLSVENKIKILNVFKNIFKRRSR